MATVKLIMWASMFIIAVILSGCTSPMTTSSPAGLSYIDIPLGGVPVKIGGSESGGKGIWSWTVELENGTTERVQVREKQGTLNVIEHQQPFTVQVPQLNIINDDGDMVITRDRDEYRLNINMIPSAQWVFHESGNRLLVLTDPTEQYKHGILGDTLEASSVTEVNLVGQPQVVGKFKVDSSYVIEGLAPLWIDWNDDGAYETILTLSNAEVGTKIVVFDENGAELAAGKAVGQGGRWRHMLTVAAFGPHGEMELAEVLTPHISGVAGFYRWDETHGILRMIAQKQGYSTHDIGSSQLNTYSLLNLNHDERVELVVPTQDKTALAILSHQEEGIVQETELPLGGRISSNIVSVKTDHGYLLTVGRKDNVLRIMRLATD